MTTEQIDPARLSELIGMIYDAAIDTRKWSIAMDAIRVELRCAISAFSLQMPVGTIAVSVTTNIPQRYVEAMPGHIMDVINQWGGIGALQARALDQPHVLSRVNPGECDFEATTNRYVLEWRKPQGLVDVIAVGLARDDRAIGSMQFARHADVGPITDREVQIMELLIPHLQRAATINRMLDLSAVAQATFEAAIETLSVPVVLTDGQLRIVYTNSAARQMLASGHLIHDRRGLLGTATKPGTRALEIAIARASTDISTLGRKGLGIPVRSDAGPNGALHVLPLRQGSALAPGAVVAVFVAHTDTPFIAPTEIVSALFELTPAEARVFGPIAEGLTVAETAAELGVEQSTVKTHMLRIYEKTGVRRRSELQRMASSLVLPVAA
ncbi:LuxR C-terminal-related transcriptional regulator [Sphingomonas sp. MMS12-HWE2-04]|uniref:LuxR C-terminal-related transcriptional regulator n=1 Tax=Sphingomonas sp. MMS12-HWE2-04 TaxID=3234199 RepID=UPI00384BC627